jgi:hypothetical protein
VPVEQEDKIRSQEATVYTKRLYKKRIHDITMLLDILWANVNSLDETMLSDILHCFLGRMTEDGVPGE